MSMAEEAVEKVSRDRTGGLRDLTSALGDAVLRGGSGELERSRMEVDSTSAKAKLRGS